MKNFKVAFLFLCATVVFVDATVASEAIEFANGCKISISSGKYTISEGGENLKYDDVDQPVFDAQTGEKVIEYSGLATDKNAIRSWAQAIFEPEASSAKHFHKDRTEDYYVTSASARAKVIIDGVEKALSTGDHIEILPGQVHQVFNLSEERELSLFVKCYPSWAFEDHNVVNE